MGMAQLSLRFADLKLSNTNPKAPAGQRTAAASIYDVMQTAFKHLHGWTASSANGPLTRTLTRKVNRDDGIREFEVIYSVQLLDTDAKPVYTAYPMTPEKINFQMGLVAPGSGELTPPYPGGGEILPPVPPDPGTGGGIIETTTAGLLADKAASALNPGQWYLVTDFQNTSVIGGTTAELTTGEIEQFYIRALDVDKLAPIGYSKTYPDEEIELNTEPFSITEYRDVTSYGDGSGIVNENDNFEIALGAESTQLVFSGDDVQYFDGANGISIDYYIASLGLYFNFNFENRGTAWNFDSATNIFTALNGFTFTDLTTEGSSIYIEYDALLATINSSIHARRNTRLDFYCQSDYRSVKNRRYKALGSNWAAGSYNAGNIVRYSSYIYMALTTTTQTPSTSASQWVRLFADSYYLAANISVSNSATGISTLLSIDTDNYSDCYIHNGQIASFDALTSKLNTQVLRHPNDSYMIKPVNVVFINGMHMAENSIIIPYLATLQGSTSNANVNLNNCIVTSSITDSNIENAANSILHQLASVNALSLTGVIASAIDYCEFTIVTNTIFRSGATKSNITSASNCIFSAKLTDCNITNISVVDTWGTAFSSNVINKMYNCTFMASVAGNQFNGDTYYTNWYSNCNRNKFMGSCYGSSNAVRQTFYSMSDNVLAKNVSLNYFSTTGGYLINNNFFGLFQNNFTTSVASNSSYRLEYNTFYNDFTNNSGSGVFWIIENLIYSIQYTQFNNGITYITKITNNILLSNFGLYMAGNIFNNTTAEFNLQYNYCAGKVIGNAFTRGNVQYNTFLGRFSENTFGNTATQNFRYNTVGNYFTGNSINATMERNTFSDYYQSKSITSATPLAI